MPPLVIYFGVTGWSWALAYLEKICVLGHGLDKIVLATRVSVKDNLGRRKEGLETLFY